MALEPAAAGEVMKHFSERELSLLTEEMTRLGEVSPTQMQQVLEEYSEVGEAVDVEPLLEKMLEQALGRIKPREFLIVFVVVRVTASRSAVCEN